VLPYSTNWIKVKNTDGTLTNDNTNYTTREWLNPSLDETVLLGGTWERAPDSDVYSSISVGVSGGCRWDLYENGLLIIYPTNSTSGTLNSFSSSAPWYNYLATVKKVVVEDGVIGNSSLSGMFSNMSNCTEMDLSGLDTTATTNMNEMFFHCSNLRELDLSNFNTSNVKNMNQMFNGCSSLTSLDLSSFDTSKVTNMRSMFFQCESLPSLDLSNFNTSQVTTMYGMFSYCKGLTELDVSHFDTSNVTDMSAMFWWCSSLTSLNISDSTKRL
jgi:surface protein